ncbi:tail virion protein G7P-2 [Kosakonia oryzendophytica]|nr:MAG TPA: Tail virion protein [Inoviridae sp.]
MDSELIHVVIGLGLVICFGLGAITAGVFR